MVVGEKGLGLGNLLQVRERCVRGWMSVVSSVESRFRNISVRNMMFCVKKDLMGRAGLRESIGTEG